MDFVRPLAALFPGPHADVLTVLAGTTRPLTGRAVARLVGDRASLRTVQKALADLERQGLVHRDVVGRSYLFAMNREHLAAAAVLDILAPRERLLDRAGEIARSCDPPPLATWLFGSLARLDGRDESDIDIVLLCEPATRARSEWTTSVDRIARSLESLTGAPAEVVEYEREEFAEAHRIGNEFARAVAREALVVQGLHPSDVIPALAGARAR